jgi:hypothetical protein
MAGRNDRNLVLPCCKTLFYSISTKSEKLFFFNQVTCMVYIKEGKVFPSTGLGGP